MLHTQELTASVLMWVLQFSTSWAAGMTQGGLVSHGTSLMGKVLLSHLQHIVTMEFLGGL